jgi:hypothetical protein
MPLPQESAILDVNLTARETRPRRELKQRRHAMETSLWLGVLALSLLTALTARGEVVKGLMSVTGAEMS